MLSIAEITVHLSQYFDYLGIDHVANSSSIFPIETYIHYIQIHFIYGAIVAIPNTIRLTCVQANTDGNPTVSPAPVVY